MDVRYGSADVFMHAWFAVLQDGWREGLDFIRLRRTQWVVERKMKRINSPVSLLALVGSLWFPLVCRAQIPKSFFGMHVNQVSSFPLQVGYGSFRDWDSNQSL